MGKLRSLSFFGSAILLTHPANAASLASTDLYTKITHDCHSLDLSTWEHPTRQAMQNAGVKIIKVELCNGGKYPIFTVSFKYDPQTQTDDYFDPLYAKMANANGFWPYSFVDIDDSLIIDVGTDKTNKNINVKFENINAATQPNSTTTKSPAAPATNQLPFSAGNWRAKLNKGTYVDIGSSGSQKIALGHALIK